MNVKTDNLSWLNRISAGIPLIIAGPCSAETKEQVLNISHQLSGSKATVFRAGVWKPRTRPGSFEGVGDKALKWLQQVKAETGLKIAIEVAKPRHVELAIKHDIDVLWIGARSTVNPFTVQELADSLKGTDRIILVKNPINPDLELWIGAVERLLKSNVNNIGVIHRGFSSYTVTNYRNQPNWQIPIDFKTRFPDIPMICDPSHICGRRDCIEKIAQTALDLQYDGLMIETHNDPDSAWSDADQQVTPEIFKQIIQRLVVREKKFRESKFSELLASLRSQIDNMDIRLIENLNERMEIVGTIGKLKKENNVAVFQQERFSEILEKMIMHGELSGLSHDFINSIFKEIHLESIRIQENIFNS
ncbi:MAG: bifunctional 3-deoxy-7-phosphoheptulonate synthase/chorismate mutase type II [Saprospiraceae bacterium]|nr:bifunctional 3-deoxy-7-phosphoheptulonate synthase/chorismate mutase type II [Saprospiraceae bacterium]